jgi:methionine salvage enolase-phosphatase E1
MTTITLADALINEVIAVGHFTNAKEAVVTVLTDYLLQHKKQRYLTELQAMQKTAGIDFDLQDL